MSIAPRLQQVWDWRAAGNFIGGGTGTGLALASAGLALAGAPWRLGLGCGLLAVAAGLAMVWAEIGRPLRFINVWFHPRTSWMTRESLLAGPLLAAGIGAVWLGWPILLAVAALLAAGFLYCQARLVHAARGIPVWRADEVVALLVVTGLTEGSGLALALIVRPGGGPPAVLAGLALAVLVLVCLRVWAWRRYRARLVAPRAALAVLARLEVPFLILGGLLPGLLALVALAWPQGAPVAGLLAGLLALGAGWALKYVLITRAAYEQGFAIPHAPARGAGAAGPGVRPGWDGDR